MEKLRILFVDDDCDFAESTSEAIGLNGYSVSTINSGEEALRIFSKKRFDIIFLDVKLPGKNGIECLTEIMKIAPEQKIVMMTAFSLDEDLEKIIKKGALAVLNKPFRISGVLEILGNIEKTG